MDVPDATPVVPTVIEAAVAVGEHDEPSVQVVPLMTIVVLTRSAFVTNPVAVKDPVTVSADTVGPVART